MAPKCGIDPVAGTGVEPEFDDSSPNGLDVSKQGFVKLDLPQARQNLAPGASVLETQEPEFELWRLLDSHGQSVADRIRVVWRVHDAP